MKFLNKAEKIDYESGISELISFLFVFPLLMSIFLLTLNLFQVSFVKEKALYTAYAACRAASTSKTLSDAEEVAQSIANENITGSYSASVEISTLNGAQWLKGNYIKTIVHIRTGNNFLPFFNPDVDQSIVMIIENQS